MDGILDPSTLGSFEVVPEGILEGISMVTDKFVGVLV